MHQVATMLRRYLKRGTVRRIQCARYSQKASDKLFEDAAREEAQKSSVKTPLVLQDPNDPIWTGDERLEHTVLRMLMDKYKPLRRQEDGRTAEKNRLDRAQKPTDLPTTTSLEEHSRHTILKPHTPQGQPWNAVYVRPSHATSNEPQVYRGKYLSPESHKSDLAKQLAKRGITSSQLALDDRKAMGELRDSLRRSLHRDRIEKAMDIRLLRHDKMRLAEAKEKQQDEEVKLPSSSQQPLLAMVGATKGLAGIAEQKIVEALKSGQLQANSLRGRPIPRDYNETNPYLQREEFVLNRMIQRQGAMPPWVQLNNDMQRDILFLRQRVQHAWICRALKNLDETNAWRDLAPVGVQWHAKSNDADNDLPSFRIEPRNEAEQRTLEWVRAFRDAAWIRQESTYHEAAVHQLNQVIRAYNHVAPASARKILYTKPAFLASAIERAYPLLVEAVSARIQGLRQRGVSMAAQKMQQRDEDKSHWFSWLWR